LSIGTILNIKFFRRISALASLNILRQVLGEEKTNQPIHRVTCRYFTWVYSSSDEDNFLGRTEAKRSNSIEEHNIVDRSLPHIHLLIMGRNGKEVKWPSLRGSDTNFIMIVDIFVSFSEDFVGREHFFTVLKAKGESEGKENL
jgi:hypothetical protein